jgi:hypothetical protein
VGRAHHVGGERLDGLDVALAHEGLRREVEHHVGARLADGGADHVALADVAAGKVPDAGRLMPAFPLEHVNAFSSAGLVALGQRFGLQRVTPTFAQRFAFLRTPGTVSTHRPKNAVKELVRPFIPYENRRNLTIWLQAPIARAR